MEPRISFVTIAAHDLPASKRFYVEGLGWPAVLDVPGEVVMVQVGQHQILALWDEAHFEAEVGTIGRGDGVPPVALAHNVASPEEVDEVLEEVRRAGAEVTGPIRRDWGGYTGYFADPDGVRWEVAYNPDEIGRLVLPG